jgi:TnpA family transposase
MKRNWELEELIEHFTMMPGELGLIGNKTAETRLGFAVMLKFFQHEARFPEQKNELPKAVMEYIAKQIKCAPAAFSRYEWTSRSSTYHRAQIREFFGFRESTTEDLDTLTVWLLDNVVMHDQETEHLRAAVYRRFREQCIEPPSLERIDRAIRSAIHSYEVRFFDSVFKAIPPASLKKMDDLIESALTDQELDIDKLEEEEPPSFSELKADPGRVGLESIMREAAKLKVIRSLALPGGLLGKEPMKILKKYQQRVASEDIRELRRHPAPIRYTLLAVFFHVRATEITDNLAELLIRIIHRIGVQAENKVSQETQEEIKRVAGKNAILGNLVGIAYDCPKGVIEEVVYPVVGRETLGDLVKEFRETKPAYRKKIHKVIRASYSSHYRRMVPELLASLEFCSNNEAHRPVIQALEIIKKYTGSSCRYFPANEVIPVAGVIRASWYETIIEPDDRDLERINRINYEIAALQALRDKLRCKEIWVRGANRYRNPDEDLPADFEQFREENYKALKQPLDAEAFIAGLKNELRAALARLNANMPDNPKVKITTKGKGWISVSPLDPQPEPAHLPRLKAELQRRWPMTSLLDILKEADLRIQFTECFRTVASREVLDRDTLQKRLILSLYGLGTNTGLKRITAGDHGENYKDLLYTRRKFIHKDNLRRAIGEVVNAIVSIRHREIWGEGTAYCASDSKKFGAWDQNLMTEWHIRYHGRGVMIYWHVDRKAVCIYSQLKSCSSSEVAAMIEGLLRHCTEVRIDKNFVDSHGQSEVAFAFCHILGFRLMPRLKAIHAQKLYRPEAGAPEDYPNLQPVLTRPINWELIRQQYEQMIKYATALRLGTAETEAILKRFTRNNLMHPTYKALGELGKVIKTIFLCEYLESEEVRREINEGLNVVENWNSANNFIFYGKGGEVATNRIEDQEIAVLSLHLLQNCLIYITTLMLQRILAEKKWFEMMTPEDFRGLTPLIYAYVNPYGSFRLDMTQRLLIEDGTPPDPDDPYGEMAS